MAKKVKTNYEFDSNLFCKTGEVRIGGKKIITPIKSKNLGKLRQKFDIGNKVGGLNEIYKIFPSKTQYTKSGNVYRYAINDYRNDQKQMDKLTYTLRTMKNRAEEDDINLAFMGYDGEGFPDDDELRFLAIQSFIHSDILPLPIIKDIDKWIKPTKLDQYKDFLSRAYEEYSNLNDKPIMGIIPKFPPAFVKNLADFYIDNDITSFYFDFNCSSPTTQFYPILEFFRRLNDYDMLDESFVYSLNSGLGRASKNSDVINTKDILSFEYGFDALGRYDVPNLPPDVLKNIDTSTKRLRLFNKNDYGYYRLLTTEIDKIYPNDSTISLDELKNQSIRKSSSGKERINRTLPNLFNLEQKGLEARRLRQIIKEATSDTYIDQKKFIRDKDKQQIKNLRDGVMP